MREGWGGREGYLELGFSLGNNLLFVIHKIQTFSPEHLRSTTHTFSLTIFVPSHTHTHTYYIYINLREVQQFLM